MDIQFVLYVEDDPSSRNILEVLLKRLLHIPHVMVLESSQNFQQMMDELDSIPEIFFLDVHVKPLNGYEMFKIIRDDIRFNSSKIVALTASVMENEVDDLKQFGFNSLIGKPINPETFPVYLEAIMSGEEIWSITWTK